MSRKVDTIKEWAGEHYDTSPGAATLLEAFTDEELDIAFRNLGEAVAFAEDKDEQKSNTDSGESQ